MPPTPRTGTQANEEEAGIPRHPEEGVSANPEERAGTQRRPVEGARTQRRPEKETGPGERPPRLTVRDVPESMILRPLADGDEPALTRIHATPEVARWWSLPEEGFPWSDEPDSIRLTIEVDEVVAGLIQFYEEPAPYRHARIDLFLDPALHGRGLGTAAVSRLVRHLIEDRGHHRITIDPSTGNAAAIRSYEKVGFRRVGVMRRYVHLPRGWQDGLLMELLAGEENPLQSE